MKFLLDVHLGRSLSDLLEQDGHSCRLVTDIMDERSSDQTILNAARENEEVILTHDLDFGTLLAFSKTAKPSVIIFRIEKINSLVFYHLIKDHWEGIESALSGGAIVIMEPDTVRIKKLPI